VDFGISQQLNVQKILVPIDEMEESRLEEMIIALGQYLPDNDNAQIYLFTRAADPNKRRVLLEKVRDVLRNEGMEEAWAAEGNGRNVSENRLDSLEAVPVRFFVEQCVDELSVSKCMREQRLIVDMRNTAEVYLRITGLSMGIPQIVYRNTQFVEDGKNGMILKEISKLPEAIDYYLNNLTNWNEAMVHSYELGKEYTAKVLITKWKEVIGFVGNSQSITAGEQGLE
jgi:accessory secretory protein Asp1